MTPGATMGVSFDGVLGEPAWGLDLRNGDAAAEGEGVSLVAEGVDVGAGVLAADEDAGGARARAVLLGAVVVPRGVGGAGRSSPPACGPGGSASRQCAAAPGRRRACRRTDSRDTSPARFPQRTEVWAGGVSASTGARGAGRAYNPVAEGGSRLGRRL
jgi:hypothetical protein